MCNSKYSFFILLLFFINCFNSNISIAKDSVSINKSIKKLDIMMENEKNKFDVSKSHNAQVSVTPEKIISFQLRDGKTYPHIIIKSDYSLNLFELRENGGVLEFEVKGKITGKGLLVRLIDQDIDGPGGNKKNDWDCFTEVSLDEYIKKLSDKETQKVQIPLKDFVGGAKWTQELGYFEKGFDWYRVKELQFMAGPNVTSVNLEIAKIKIINENENKNAVDIFVNQLTYIPDYPKRLLIRSLSIIESPNISIYNTNKKVYNGTAKYIGEYKKWGEGHYYEFYFTELNTNGKYFAELNYSGIKYKSPEFFIGTNNLEKSIDYNLNFLKVQHCGEEVPGFHPLCHADDGKLSDNKHFDAAGGWHDAGDVNKYTYTSWITVYGLLKLYEIESDTEFKKRIYKEAKWGNDWILKMVKPNGNIYSAVYNSFDKNKVVTDNIKNNKDDRPVIDNLLDDILYSIPQCSSAILLMSLLSDDKKYSGKNFEYGLRMYKYFEKRKPVLSSNENINVLSGYALSSLYLYRITNDVKYKEKAQKIIKMILRNQNKKNGYFYNKDNPGEPFIDIRSPLYFMNVLFEYIEHYPDDKLSDEILMSLNIFSKKYLYGFSNINPYGNMMYLKADGKIKNFGLYMDYMGTIVQGNNSYHLMTAGISIKLSKILNDKKLLDIGINQINWVCGLNPFSICMLEGFGNNLQYYHSILSIYNKDKYNKVKGIIPNGIGSVVGSDDKPYIDLTRKSGTRTTKWQTNEPWININGWWLLWLARYYE